METLKRNESLIDADCEPSIEIDVGTIIDNSNPSVSVEKSFKTKEEAKQYLIWLKAKAESAALQNYQVSADIVEMHQKIVLKAIFTFECEAESMIFQFSTR